MQRQPLPVFFFLSSRILCRDILPCIAVVFSLCSQKKRGGHIRNLVNINSIHNNFSKKKYAFFFCILPIDFSRWMQYSNNHPYKIQCNSSSLRPLCTAMHKRLRLADGFYVYSCINIGCVPKLYGHFRKPATLSLPHLVHWLAAVRPLVHNLSF